MVLLPLLVILAAKAAVVVAFQPDSSYIRSYGSLTIPCPFGTSEGCFLDESFHIICSNSLGTSKPLLSSSNNARNANVLSISLDSELRVSTFVKHDCSNGTN
ncbi:hypothetical protein CFP56_033739 [Quercus suber]|uniref:Wall-associated receptor kinase galacturonan-binding domain-containing protein n=1 Tax=Quercus suber TaxID=58331 RepID=A0AAW0LUF7_QUESU